MRPQQVLLLALVPAILSAASSNAPTLEQSVSMRTVAEAIMSPDGGMVAYTVRTANWEANEYESEIWVANTLTSDRYRLTGGKKSSSSPAWSPDGKHIAFASDRDGKRQIYLISSGLGEAAALTSMESGVEGFEWMPDGSAIVFTAPEPESAAMKERKKRYGQYAIVKGDYTYSNLWMVKVPAASDSAAPATPVRLTEGTAHSVQSFRISPDGGRIAYSAVKIPDLSAEPSDLWLLHITDKMRKPLVESKGPDSNPVWSPDSRQIAFVTSNEDPHYFYRNNKLAIVSAEGGKPVLVPLSFDEDVSPVQWTKEGIFFIALQKTSSHLFRADPASGQFQRISAPVSAVLQSVSFSRNGTRIAFAASLEGKLAEAYATGLAPFTPKLLSTLGDQLKDYALASREVIRWKSTDGVEIEGVLIKPPDFTPDKKYPLLVVVHGGPTGVDRPVITQDRYYPIERFVAKGALVLRPNYRGSAGYGEKFRSLNVRNLGVGDAWDVLSGVDSLIAKGYVDKDLVGCMGWSQGGYISAFLTTSTTRFRAISVGAGISNWMTYYVNTDIHPFTRQYLHAVPWDDPAIYAKTSPMTYIKKAKTPTLIQHGEFDRRVPIPNAYELFQGLEDQGVPVRMYVYKGFGHAITKPKEMLAVLQHNYDFFAEYIWSEKPAL